MINHTHYAWSHGNQGSSSSVPTPRIATPSDGLVHRLQTSLLLLQHVPLRALERIAETMWNRAGCMSANNRPDETVLFEACTAILSDLGLPKPMGLDAASAAEVAEPTLRAGPLCRHHPAFLAMCARVARRTIKVAPRSDGTGTTHVHGWARFPDWAAGRSPAQEVSGYLFYRDEDISPRGPGTPLPTRIRGRSPIQSAADTMA